MRVSLLLPLALALGCAHGGSEPAVGGASVAEPPSGGPAPPQATAAPPAAERALTTTPLGACAPAAVFFATDSAALTAEDKATLDRAAECLRCNPALEVTIVGSADLRGPARYNLALSRRRAHAVADYLGGKGISGRRFRAIFSAGESSPQCRGTSPACLAKNRHATIRPATRM